MCNAGKKLRCRICNTKLGTYKREQRSTCYDQHDSTGCLCRIHKNVKQVFELNLTVDHHTNKQTVNNRYGCGLSWCKDTTVNSSEDDNRHQESPECIFKCIPALFCGSFFTGWLNIMFLCLDHNDDHKSNTHQKSRNDTSHKHICNRYACDGSIYNECDTRRYDNGDGTGSCHQCRGNGAEKPPCSTIAGIRTAPSAATVAGPEPEIAPKKQATITHTMAIPPFLCPTQVSTKLISRFEIPAFA